MGRDNTLPSQGAFLIRDWAGGVVSPLGLRETGAGEAQDHLQSWWHGRKNNHHPPSARRCFEPQEMQLFG